MSIHWAPMLVAIIAAAGVLACAGDDHPAPPASGAATTAHPDAVILTHGDPARNAVAVTFDVGSTPAAGHAGEILRILREHGVRATFSLTGIWAEQNRDLLFAIAADGHQIINGTYDGRSFVGPPALTSDERRLALFRTETTVYRYTSRTTKPYTRPPGGELDATTARDAAAEGYTTIALWTVDSRDIVPAAGETLAAAALGRAEPGAIYRLSTTRAEDAAALLAIIAGLREEAYALETIEDLLSP